MQEGLIFAFIHAIVFFLFLWYIGLFDFFYFFGRRFLNLLMSILRESFLPEYRKVFEIIAFFLLLNDFGNNLDELVVVGPIIGEKFGIYEHVVNIDLKSSHAGESHNFITLFVKICIGRKPGFRRFGKFIRNWVLDNNSVIDKSLQLPLHWIMAQMYINWIAQNISTRNALKMFGEFHNFNSTLQ